MANHICQECNGVGRVGVGDKWIECSECNGTGIAGNPLYGCLIGLGVLVFWIALYLVWMNW